MLGLHQGGFLDDMKNMNECVRTRGSKEYVEELVKLDLYIAFGTFMWLHMV